MPASVLDNTALLGTLIAFRKGDFSARLPYDLIGIEGKVADTINEIFDMNLSLREELARLSSTVGKEGRILSAPLFRVRSAIGQNVLLR